MSVFDLKEKIDHRRIATMAPLLRVWWILGCTLTHFTYMLRVFWRFNVWPRSTRCVCTHTYAHTHWFVAAHSFTAFLMEFISIWIAFQSIWNLSFLKGGTFQSGSEQNSLIRSLLSWELTYTFTKSLINITWYFPSEILDICDVLISGWQKQHQLLKT